MTRDYLRRASSIQYLVASSLCVSSSSLARCNRHCDETRMSMRRTQSELCAYPNGAVPRFVGLKSGTAVRLSALHTIR